jgi:hypothetical protein
VSRFRTAAVCCLSSAALAVVAAPAQASSDAQSARVRNCNHFAHYPNTKVTSARNMSCRRARRDLRRYRGSIKRRFKTPGGFRCRRVSGGRLGGEWRCVKGRRAYRFEFGD